jgi:hypothetical protein
MPAGPTPSTALAQITSVISTNSGDHIPLMVNVTWSSPVPSQL